MKEPVVKRSWKVRAEAEAALQMTGEGRREGWVGTKRGVVLAYVDYRHGREGTVLRFNAGGRLHRWEWDVAYSDRHVARLAAHMARELAP